MKTLTTLFCLLATSAFVLTGCGGGGGGAAATGPTYSGAATPAAITATNAEAIGTTTAEAASQAITQSAVNDANPFAMGITINPDSTNLNPALIELVRNIGVNAQYLNLPAGVTTLTHTQLMNDDPTLNLCGGSVQLSDAIVNSLTNTMTLNGSITFINLCSIDPNLGNIIMNGTLTFTETVDTLSIRFSNFSVNDGSSTETMNMTVSCTFGFACSISADYEAADGKVYRVADMTISGADTGPYFVSATFYHPDYGSVTINTSDLYFNCSNGHPSSGTIYYTSSTNGSSGSITFTDCTSYTGTYDDGAAAAGSSGPYSGSWL